MFTDDTASNVDAINHEGLSVLSYLMKHESVQDTLTAQCSKELVDDAHRLSDDVDKATETTDDLALEMVKADALRELADIKKTETYIDSLERGWKRYDY